MHRLRLFRALFALALVASLTAPATARKKHNNNQRAHALSGIASWYDCVKPGECSRSKITASGERFNMHAMTAAHRTLPFGTRVTVTNVKTGRSVVVRISDRGPASWTGRVLDLSRGAANQLGTIASGTAQVVITPHR